MKQTKSTDKVSLFAEFAQTNSFDLIKNSWTSNYFIFLSFSEIDNKLSRTNNLSVNQNTFWLYLHSGEYIKRFFAFKKSFLNSFRSS